MRGAKEFSINKKHYGLIRFLSVTVALIFVLVILNLFISPVKNIFHSISYPIQRTFWTAGESSSTFISSFLKAGGLAKENADLKNENEKLLSQVAFLSSIEQGNQAQSDVSASCQNNGFKFTMAGVIGLDQNDMLSINKGSADGISVGMPVISQQNVLFGKVFRVYKNYSEIMLISNKSSVVNVEVQQNQPAGLSGEIDGVVRGSGGLDAYLDLVPISNEINEQDVLVTSAIEKSFPKNLLVGKIIQKEKNDQKPFQQAQISLFLNVKSADNLFVITNYKQANLP